MTNRRNFLKTTAFGASALAFSPSFSHLFGASTQSGQPPRYLFIRKSNGNLPKQFSLPSFSAQEKKMDTEKNSLST